MGDEFNPQWLSFFTALITAIITITGWIVTSRLSYHNNGKNEKNKEINRLIDELYQILDVIYSEMLILSEITRSQRSKVKAYFRFISLVRKIQFLCERIQSLDSEQKIQNHLITELRQNCTDERKYEKDKISMTLAELQLIQEDIKKLYNKKFS
ncbi:TPA: hypothetical protein OOF66_004000 [Morganella morganii]|uniref:hypothetical protein n=1 Tax=Morganella morganii TaxID=582 RepID=UPI001330933F|nr:hypothetical protein [Morganella morganii]HCR4037706.1 hypothetical protein [Morganella morganii]HCR4051887.1 hypothetical protein [Morganella morganii]